MSGEAFSVVLALIVFGVVLALWFAGTWFWSSGFPKLVELSIGEYQKKIDLGQKGRRGEELSLDEGFHKRRVAKYLIFCVVILLLIPFKDAGKPSADKEAERLMKGYFGATVIECYQMSDWEMLANQARCKDALRRVRGY